jgi:hypothetical protein
MIKLRVIFCIFYLLNFRHLSEQYFTSSQFFAHALRQVISRWQTAQILLGKLDLLPLNELGFVTPIMTAFNACSSSQIYSQTK